jgi:CBS domain containing-hemolysin-like protein
VLALILTLGLLALALHMGAVCLAHALRSYSRSLLEDRCARRGHPGRADAVARDDELTERSADGLATLTGLLLAGLLGSATDLFDSTLTADLVIVIALVLAAAGHVAAAVIGRVHAEAVIDRAWPLTGTLRLAMRPLTGLHRFIETAAYRRSKRGLGSPRPASVEVEIPSADVTEEQELEAELPDAIREMLARVVELTRMDVARLMTPASTMLALPATVAASAAARAFVDSGFSRIPLFGESRDDIVGILYAKDLFAAMVQAGDAGDVLPRKLARPPLFVPETKNAAELLQEFQQRRVQMAIVLDEYGGVAGLISFEDLVEHVTGPIEDEHDQPAGPADIVPLGGSRYEVDASVPLEVLNERLDLNLPTDEEFSTLGGLVFHELGHLPEPGATFRREGVEFTVLSLEGRTIRRLRLDLNPTAAAHSP